MNKDDADIRAWEAGGMGINCLAFQMRKRGGTTCLKVLSQLGAELDSCTVWGILMECAHGSSLPRALVTLPHC